jgi:hypothetical protein
VRSKGNACLYLQNREKKMSHAQAQQYFVAYNPQLSQKFGSAIAAAIFQRFEYWADKMKARPEGQGSFYKFIDACQHPCYKTGDSWCEELGISRKVFRNHFSKIGTSYKSKSDFLKKDDPFEGKYFAYYQDCKTNKTIFVRNHILLQEFYDQLKQLLTPSSPIKKTAPKTHNCTTNQSLSSASQRPTLKGKPRAVPVGQPYGRMVKDKQSNTSSLKETRQIILSPIAQQMLTIWQEEIGDRGLSFTSSLQCRLENTLQQKFKGCLDLWRLHCRRIASSSFLMGEKPGTSFQIRLSFALSDAFIEGLQEGKYELATRKTRQDLELEKLNHSLELLEKEAYKAKSLRERAEREKEGLIRKAANEAYEALSEARKQEFQALYEADYLARYADESLKPADVWKQPLAETFFEVFILGKLRQEVQLDPQKLREINAAIKAGNHKLEQISAVKQLGLKAKAELYASNAGLVSKKSEPWRR